MNEYRLTFVNKWTDKWFLSLDKDSKLLFMFLCDNCDKAGFYEVDYKAISFMTGLTKQDVKNAMSHLSKRFYWNKDKSFIWVKNFIRHQRNFPLSPFNHNHKPIVNRLKYMFMEKGFEQVYHIFEVIPTEHKLAITDEMGEIQQAPASPTTEIKETTTPEKKPEPKPKPKPKPTPEPSKQPEAPTIKFPNKLFIVPTLKDVEQFMKIDLEFEAWREESPKFFNYNSSKNWVSARDNRYNWKELVERWVIHYREIQAVEYKKKKEKLKKAETQPVKAELVDSENTPTEEMNAEAEQQKKIEKQIEDVQGKKITNIVKSQQIVNEIDWNSFLDE